MARFYVRHLGTGTRCQCPKQCGPTKAAWTVTGDVGRDESGRRLQKTLGGFKTKAAAEKAWYDLRRSIDKGADPFVESLTVAAFCDRWLGHMASRVRPKTLGRYRDHVALRIVPALGGLRLDKVKVGHVQDAVDRWNASGLAPRTVIATRGVLLGAMGQAVKWQLITTNPVLAVQPPRAERPNLTVPTAPELMALVDAAEGTVWEIAVMLSATTGARRGEVLALRWADIDLDTGRVRITGTLSEGPGGWTRQDPKTDRGRRSVTLPAFALERLRAERKRTVELMLASGATWDWVCHRAGEPLDPDEYSKQVKTIAARAGLPPSVRLHDLRHAVATLWLEQGLHPGIASAALGHASPGFTLAVYSHVTDAMGDKAAAALENAFAQNR